MRVSLKEKGRVTLWFKNIHNGIKETVPRYVEIDNVLVQKTCRRLKIPNPFGEN
jgi:hypothetical protein